MAAYTAAFSNAPPGMGCPDGDDADTDPGDCTGYELVADVDLGVAPYNEDEGWVPISGSGWYGATFEGNGHTISGLTITNPDLQEVGLFGGISGVVRNLGIIAPTVSVNSFTGSGGARVGALAGQIDGTVERVFVRGGSVSSNDAGSSSPADPTLIGGLLGRVLVGGSVTDSYSTAAVSGTANHQNVGGLVGRMQATAAGTVDDHEHLRGRHGLSDRHQRRGGGRSGGRQGHRRHQHRHDQRRLLRQHCQRPVRHRQGHRQDHRRDEGAGLARHGQH